MKKLTLILLTLFAAVNAFTEELEFVTVRDATAWKYDAEYSTIDLLDEDIETVLPKGTLVTLHPVFRDHELVKREGNVETVEKVFAYAVIDTNTEKKYWVLLSDLQPANTSAVFDKSFITEAHKPSRYLMSEYFIDVLQSGTRTPMQKYEEEWVRLVGEGNEYDPPWWEETEITQSAMITSSAIHLKFFQVFFVQNIEDIENGYKVFVKPLETWYEDGYFPKKDELTLLFQFDGDYVDIYIDTLDNKVFSLVYVSLEFYEGVKTVIEKDTPVDLTNMIWPRRTDDSSDYDSNIVRNHAVGSTYRATDNIRVRDAGGLTGNSLFVLPKYTPVRVIEHGVSEVIDGISAFWLQVEVAEDSTDTEGNNVAEGTTGWLFGGYVSMEKEAGYEIQIAEEEPMYGENASGNEETEETEPFFPLIPIIAVVAVLLLCVIIVVVKTKKKSTT